MGGCAIRIQEEEIMKLKIVCLILATALLLAMGGAYAARGGHINDNHAGWHDNHTGLGLGHLDDPS
jgi:hypothetical protein